MSDSFDRLLAAPGEADLVAALDSASQRGPGELRGERRWRVILDEVAEYAEGRSQLEHSSHDDPTHYVSVAWWSDHQGTKYVRVCGGTLGDGWHPHYSRLDDDMRPPLWHVFMSRVYRVTRRGEEAEWLVSCACGMTGTPRELGWMGERCGPCHDRHEEGQPHEDEGRWVLFADEGRGHSLAFSHDGARLAVASGRYYLRIIDIADGSRALLSERDLPEDASEDDAWHPLAFSPDGRWLVGGLPQEYVVNFWDLRNNSAESDWVPHRPGEAVSSMGFSPDGSLFAMCSDEKAFDVTFADDSVPYLPPAPPPDNAAAFAFNPNGGELAVAHEGRLSLYDTGLWGEPRSLSVDLDVGDELLFLQYTPDGERLVLITGERDLHSRPHRLRVLNVQSGREEKVGPISPMLRVAGLSPDGGHLAYVVGDERHSPGEIHFWDLARWEDGGRLEWNPEDALVDLAFSPDGETLATLSWGGVVKLWPWRLLLG